MSKHLFELLIQQEIETSNFLPTKKEVELSGKKFAKSLLESGEIDKLEAFAQAERICQGVSVIRDEIKATLPREKQTAYGIEINPINGRQMIQYNEDLVWSELKEKISNREELLKLALKTTETFYDSEGIEVPKVSVKYSADSLTIKY